MVSMASRPLPSAAFQNEVAGCAFCRTALNYYKGLMGVLKKSVSCCGGEPGGPPPLTPVSPSISSVLLLGIP